MRKIKELIFASVCLLGMTVAVSSCVEPGPDGPDKPAITGSTIMLPNEANAVVEVTLDMKSDWNVSNANTWFTVQPLSGVAGQATFTITVLEANPELTEKVASFRINEGDTPTEYYVVQDVTPGMSMVNTGIALSDASQESSFTFSSNVAVSVTSNADWVTVSEVKKDSVLLADNATYSKLKTYTVNFSTSENSGEVREANIEVSGEGLEKAENFVVTQMGVLVADYSRTFTRRSLVVRYTGNWCGYCPAMNLALHDAIDQYPDHIVAMNMYQGSGDLSFSKINDFMNLFNIQGFPTAIMNYYCEVGNTSAYQSNTTRFVNLAKEAVNKLPAKTVLGGVATISGNNVEVEVSVASKEAGSYFISAFLLEDGIIGTQSDYLGLVDNPAEYDHSNVVRSVLTAEMGDPYSLSASGLERITFTVPVPEDVVNPENLHVVVFAAYEGSFDGSLRDSYVSYNDYGYVVDNVVNIPVGGFAVFSYEN